MGSGLSQRFLYGSERGTVPYDRGATCTVSFGKGTKKTIRLPAKRLDPDPTREYIRLLVRSVSCWTERKQGHEKKQKHRIHVYSWPKGVRFCLSASRATLSTAREDRDTDYGFTPSAWYISFDAIPGTVSALADLVRLR